MMRLCTVQPRHPNTWDLGRDKTERGGAKSKIPVNLHIIIIIMNSAELEVPCLWTIKHQLCQVNLLLSLYPSGSESCSLPAPC